MAGPGEFVDAVFAAENLSKEADERLAGQVRAVVDKYFVMWQKAEEVSSVDPAS